MQPLQRRAGGAGTADGKGEGKQWQLPGEGQQWQLPAPAA